MLMLVSALHVYSVITHNARTVRVYSVLSVYTLVHF